MAEPVMVDPEALERLRAAFERCKAFPEASPDGWVRMLELRQAAEKLLERV